MRLNSRTTAQRHDATAMRQRSDGSSTAMQRRYNRGRVDLGLRAVLIGNQGDHIKKCVPVSACMHMYFTCKTTLTTFVMEFRSKHMNIVSHTDVRMSYRHRYVTVCC